MIKKKIRSFQERMEDHLRRVCGRMTPERRIITVLVIFLAFTGLSLYITASAIYNFGRGEGKKLNIRHIESLQLELEQVNRAIDSIKTKNHTYHDDDTEISCYGE